MAPHTPRILFVLTSHGQLGKSGEKTGFHYEEMTTPYYILKDAGFEVDLASIKGGEPPADPGSLKENDKDNPESVQRFRRDDKAMAALRSTKPVSDIVMTAYDAIYFPGGHGTMWDFPGNPDLAQLLENAYEEDKIIAAICHGPAAFIGPEIEGQPLISGRDINAFTDEEEKKAGKDQDVPFLLESRLIQLGANFKKAPPQKGIVVEDLPFITGQNPASAEKVGKTLANCLVARAARYAA